MYQTKFYKAIKKLSVFEINEYSDLVNSPFYNKNKHIIQLWELLEPQIKADTSLFDRELLHQKIYNEPFDEIKFNNLLSDLYQLLEEYFAQLQLKKQIQQKELLIMKQLNQRQLHKHFKQVERRILLYSDNNPSDPDSLHMQYLYNAEADDHYLRQSKKQKKNYLQEKMNFLDLHFMTAKLKTACEMLNRQGIINIEYSTEFLNQVLQKIEASPEKYHVHPLLSAYLHIYKTFIKPEQEKHFQALIKYLELNSSKISSYELREMYDYAQNYCIRKINTGKIDFLNELFEIYQRLLEQGLLQQEEYFSQWDYKNIVTVGIRLKKYDWIREFIETYKAELAPADAENAYIYNLSTLFFAEKKYDQAIELLRDVEFTDVLYHLGAKTTLLKIYYEQQEEDAFFNLTDTFNTYLHRNKMISTTQKQSYKNMLRFSKKIFKLQINRNYYSANQYLQRYQKISEKLKELQNIANINWINEIMEEAVPAESLAEAK